MDIEIQGEIYCNNCQKEVEEKNIFWTNVAEVGEYYRRDFCSSECKKSWESQAQKWLDENYPDRKARKEIKELNLSNKNLTGILDLSEFVNLEVLNFSKNDQLIKLTLPDNLQSKILKINANDTGLSDLAWLNNVSKNLTDLDVSNCISLKENLDIFKEFINLERLNISGCDFTGSLAGLSNCLQLNYLNISGQKNIQDDIEYLPDSLKEFIFTNNQKIKAKLQGFFSEIDISTWKESNPKLAFQAKQEIIQDQWKKLTQSYSNIDELISEKDLLIIEIDEKSKQLNLLNQEISNKIEESERQKEINQQLLEKLAISEQEIILNKDEFKKNLFYTNKIISDLQQRNSSLDEIKINQEKKINKLEINVQEKDKELKKQELLFQKNISNLKIEKNDLSTKLIEESNVNQQLRDNIERLEIELQDKSIIKDLENWETILQQNRTKNLGAKKTESELNIEKYLLEKITEQKDKGFSLNEGRFAGFGEDLQYWLKD